MAGGHRAGRQTLQDHAQPLRAQHAYARAAGLDKELVVEPHGLVSAGSDWYLCASGEETVRFFKAVRIKHAALLAEPCSGPELDVAQAWRDHRARFLNQFTPVSVDAWARAARWDDAREWSICSSPMDAAGSPPGEGWRSVRLEFMDDLHAVTVLLRLGSDVRVEAPDDIKTKLLDNIDQIATLYRS
ncbi:MULTISPECIES: helix-turn-helix transcriptional regulator [Actinomyces]|uniref:helix-turn-helix transcriptional regulator n=1 Tax=Actinomyces TaxID=1654 RepID=UPI0022A695DF|nr:MULTISPECIES: WYL domain-containing protein [Actinomyces]